MDKADGSRLRQRIETRRARMAAGLDPGPVPTEEDARNLRQFDADTRAVTALLEDEIAAIRTGRLETVTELYPRKADLLKRIELVMPVIEPFLRARIGTDAGLRDRLAALRRAVQEDSGLLEHMAETTAEIVRDIKKICNRHSLDGLYGKSGRRVTGAGAEPRAIDKTI